MIENSIKKQIKENGSHDADKSIKSPSHRCSNSVHDENNNKKNINGE